MSYTYCIKRRKKGKHLTFEEREELEFLVRKNLKLPKKKRLSQRKMAEYIGVSPATICRELKRGHVISVNSQCEEQEDYSAVIGQQEHDHRAQNKGPSLSIGNNQELAKKIEEQILDKNSPYCTLENLRNEPCYQRTPISLRTLYNYIEKNLFLNISKIDLPRKGRCSKRKYTRVKKRPRRGGAKSIDQRPQVANNRSEYGHWEMDCIESGKGKSRSVILNLTERSTRECLLFKMTSQKSKNVVKVLDNLERRIGAKTFREKFKGITVDNGSEFMDWEGMETSAINYRGKKQRTEIYYCHPYHSWERGTNEQTNGLIRYFIPKGSNISSYSQKEIKEIEYRLNTMPRKIFDGRSALEEKKRLLSMS
ncbi:IS30 family transposase [Peptoniphilus sp. SGI.035]|uniref:IS30 family transposase n=1 Tax=Peptoniphilus sp. SGI.035 TaxID=3420564 RepID=UPI003D036D4E